MSMLNLTKVNHATIIPDEPTYAGMLQKAKDFVTLGEVDAENNRYAPSGERQNVRR